MKELINRIKNIIKGNGSFNETYIFVCLIFLLIVVLSKLIFK